MVVTANSLSQLQTGTRFYSLPNVVAFRTGWWNGRPHSIADLEELAGNFNRFIQSNPPIYVPFATENHDDGDRCGWISACRVVDDRLLTDIADVPEDVARRVADGRLAYPSIEYWDTRNDPRARLLSGLGFSSPGGTPPGLVLRCVTLLGSLAPGAKGLPPLPAPRLQPGSGSRLGMPGFSPSTLSFLDRSTSVKRFSAESFMDRSQILASVKAAYPGISDDTLALLSDDALSAMLNDAQQSAATGANAAVPGADAMAPPPDATAGQMDMGGGGMDPSMMGGGGGSMSPGMQQPTQQMSDAAALRKFAYEAKLERVNAVLASACAAGKLMPNQVDFARKQGMATAVTVIPKASATFADAVKKTGKQTPTPFDVWVAEINALPADPRFVHKFDDRSGSSLAQQASSGHQGSRHLTAEGRSILGHLSVLAPRLQERIEKRFAGGN